MGVDGFSASSFSISDRDRFLDVRGGVCGGCALAQVGCRIFDFEGFLALSVGFEVISIGLASEGGAVAGALVVVGGSGMLLVRSDCSA